MRVFVPVFAAVMFPIAPSAEAAERPGAKLDSCLNRLIESDAGQAAQDTDALHGLLFDTIDCLDIENQHCSWSSTRDPIICISHERRFYRAAMGAVEDAAARLQGPYPEAIGRVESELEAISGTCDDAPVQVGFPRGYIKAKCEYELMATRFAFLRFAVLHGSRP